MTDDWCNPNNPEQDCHSVEMAEAEKEMDRKDYCEPPNMGNVLWRLPELITDQSCNQLSMSRLTFGLIGLSVAFSVVYETLAGRIGVIMGSVAAIMATVATVYAISTGKDWRWKRRDKE